VEVAGIASEAENRTDPEVILFSESNTRFLIEVPKDRMDDLVSLFSSIPWQAIGTVTDEKLLRIFGRKAGEPIISMPIADLKEAWQKPLRW